MLYERINRKAPMGLHLDYQEPKVTPDAPLIVVDVDDVGITPSFYAWWSPKGTTF